MDCGVREDKGILGESPKILNFHCLTTLKEDSFSRWNYEIGYFSSYNYESIQPKVEGLSKKLPGSRVHLALILISLAIRM